MMRKGAWLVVLIGLLTIGVASYAQVQTSSELPDQQEAVQTASQTVTLPAISPDETTQDASAPLIVVFYEEDCPDCGRMEGLLNELLVGHEGVPVARYEINTPGSSALLWKLAARHGIVATQVPVIFIGDQAIVGAGRAQEINLRTAVGDCIQRGCPLPLEYVEGGQAVLRDLLIVGVFVGLFIAFRIFQGL